MALSGSKIAPTEKRSRVDTATQFKKCDDPKCGQTLFVKDIERNHYCCKYCGHHFRISSDIRIKMTLDPGSWSELFTDITPTDPLGFEGMRPYKESLERDQKKTGLNDAVVCGVGRIHGIKLVLAVMDFRFIGGSMGSVVGEKVTLALEYATEHRQPIVIFCCSGGARMQEGALSLMQMAKTSAAIQRHNEAQLPFFTVLTDPTLAGVSASYAFLADVIIGEPRAMIGFTGARVIEQTIRKKLPEGFQEAEFLLKHGQIDLVTARKEIRDTLARLLTYACPLEPAGQITLPPIGKKSDLQPEAEPAQALVTQAPQATPKKKAPAKKATGHGGSNAERPARKQKKTPAKTSTNQGPKTTKGSAGKRKKIAPKPPGR